MTIRRRDLFGWPVAALLAGPLREAFAAAPAGARSMRITDFEVIPTRVPMHERVREAWQASFRRQNRFQTHYTPTLVKVRTDEGLTGIGDAQMSPAQANTTLDRMVGHSPWEYLQDDSLRGILVAIYDLAGQAAGLPVARLFAANPRERIVQTWWSQCLPPDLMASEARLGASLGYRIHKVKARPWEDPIEQAAAICDAIPHDMRVWVDANAWWGSPARTMFFVERLSEFHNYFAIESPIPRDHVDGYRALKGSSPLLVAEHWPADPMTFIREGLVTAFVVGAPLGRGLVHKAHVAEAARIPLWVEHSIDCGINQVFQAHQAAAFPSIEYAISVTHVLADDLMAEEFQMEDGFYRVPAKPGLGVSLDDAAVDKYRVRV